MAPKDILQSLKSSLERDSQFEDKVVTMNLEYCDEFARGTIMRFIEGKWVGFEVLARPLGNSSGLQMD